MGEVKGDIIFFKETRDKLFFDSGMRKICNKIIDEKTEEIEEFNNDIKSYDEKITVSRRRLKTMETYEQEKQKLQDLNLLPEEYEKEIKKLAERLKI